MSTYGNSSPSPAASATSIVAMQNTIDSVFGYSIATTTTFLQSGTIELGSANKAYSLEVVYPILGKNTNTRNPRPSPALSSSGKRFYVFLLHAFTWRYNHGVTHSFIIISKPTLSTYLNVIFNEFQSLLLQYWLV